MLEEGIKGGEVNGASWQKSRHEGRKWSRQEVFVHCLLIYFETDTFFLFMPKIDFATVKYSIYVLRLALLFPVAPVRLSLRLELKLIIRVQLNLSNMQGIHSWCRAAIDRAKANLICTLSPCSWSTLSLPVIIRPPALSLPSCSVIRTEPRPPVSLWVSLHHADGFLCLQLAPPPPLIICVCSFQGYKNSEWYKAKLSPPSAPFYPAFKFKYSILPQWERDVYCVLSKYCFISFALLVYAMFFVKILQSNCTSLRSWL